MAEIVDFGLQQHKIKMDSRYFENVLSVVAGDTGRRLEVQLLDTNGMVQDTTGLNLRLNAEIAGKATFTDATLVDAVTGKYQLDLSNGMFLAPGNWEFQWQITDSAGKKLHSFAFTGNIGKNISEGGSQATNFYLNLEDLKAMQDDLISGAFDSALLETNIAEKLEAKEIEYAPKLTELDQQANEPSIYKVGKNQKFKTIKSAYLKWVADGKPEPAIVDIYPGTYKEFINGGANNLVFRSHSGLGTVIWISDSGYYPDAPYTGGANGKELVFEGLIIKATHDGTPNWSSTTGGMYALHIDYPGATGKTIIRNSILISDQDAALGSGTRINQTIELENVKLFSKSVFAVAGAPGVNHGALFYHTSSDLNQTGQELIMHNVYAHSLNGPGIAIQSNATGNTDVKLEAINVIGRSDEYETYTGISYENRVSFTNTNGKIKISQDSKLNNSSKLNASVQGVKSNTGLLTFNRNLTQTGTQAIPYDATREIDLILFKMGIDSRNVYSDGFYRAGIANVTYNEETTSAKYSYTGKVLAISQNALANRTIGEVTSVANGVITLNWTHIGTGATGNGVGNIIVFYKS